MGNTTTTTSSSTARDRSRYTASLSLFLSLCLSLSLAPSLYFSFFLCIFLCLCDFFFPFSLFLLDLFFHHTLPLSASLSSQLYTHIPIMKKILNQLEDWNYKLCCVFILDGHLVDLPSKFVSGSLYCLSAMMQMGLAQVTTTQQHNNTTTQQHNNTPTHETGGCESDSL